MPVTNNPRSVLHALVPIGMGTPDVESLLSYFCRLALSHSTSTVALSITIAEKIGTKLQPNFAWHDRRICGLGDSALTWSAAISALTTVPHLDALTFQPWCAVIAQNGLPVNTRGKFCAACFQEDLEAGRTPYFRLAWEAGDVRACHRHHTALRQHCRHCERANVRHTSAFVAPGWCTRCGGFLGEPVQSHEPVTLQAVWRAKQVSGLIAHQHALSMAPQRQAFLTGLEHLLVEMDGGNAAAFARRVGVSRTTLFSTLKGIGTPTLKLSLNIASQCSIPLVKLLTGDVTQWNPPSTAQMPLLPLKVESKRAVAREINWLEVEASMQQFVKSIIPVSVHEAARRLALDERQLYLRVNRLARELSARWSEHRSRQHEAHLLDAWPQIEAACEDAMKDGGRSVYRADVEARVPPNVLSKVPHLHSVIALIQASLLTD